MYIWECCASCCQSTCGSRQSGPTPRATRRHVTAVSDTDGAIGVKPNDTDPSTEAIPQLTRNGQLRPNLALAAWSSLPSWRYRPFGAQLPGTGTPFPDAAGKLTPPGATGQASGGETIQNKAFATHNVFPRTSTSAYYITGKLFVARRVFSTGHRSRHKPASEKHLGQRNKRRPRRPPTPSVVWTTARERRRIPAYCLWVWIFSTGTNAPLIWKTVF